LRKAERTSYLQKTAITLRIFLRRLDSLHGTERLRSETPLSAATLFIPPTKRGRTT
jgi:hypothetical protein